MAEVTTCSPLGEGSELRAACSSLQPYWKSPFLSAHWKVPRCCAESEEPSVCSDHLNPVFGPS